MRIRAETRESRQFLCLAPPGHEQLCRAYNIISNWPRVFITNQTSSRKVRRNFGSTPALDRMGIDSANESISSAIMFDRRAQMFNNNRWFSNQVTEQTPYTMNAISNFDRVDSPLGSAALTMPFAEYGSSSTNRPLSTRFPSTDSSNDPDGPAMDNGNGNCQSPGLDSIYSDPAALGTPNSFVTDQSPGSPDIFTGQRERTISNGSAYTYSPYSTREDEGYFAPGQACIIGDAAYARQASINRVEEVLGPYEDNDQPLLFLPDTDSPVQPCGEDSCLPPYPSPTFSAHFNASTNDADAMITSSQDERFFQMFLNTDMQLGVQCAGSPVTESNETTSSCNEGTESQTEQSPVTECPTTTSTDTTFLAPTAPALMSRQPSSMSDLLTEVHSNSLDASAMLQDFLDANPSQSETTLTTVNTSVLSVPRVVQVPVQIADEQPSSSRKNVSSHNDENANPTTSNHKETNVVAARRERNNAACRMSRKRRKDKKEELENQVFTLDEENQGLRVKIEQLEIECKRVKQSILAHMSNNTNPAKTR